MVTKESWNCFLLVSPWLELSVIWQQNYIWPLGNHKVQIAYKMTKRGQMHYIKHVLHRTTFFQEDILMSNLAAIKQLMPHHWLALYMLHYTCHNQNRTDGLCTKSVDPLWLYVHHIQLYLVVLTEHWQLNGSCKTSNSITYTWSSVCW